MAKVRLDDILDALEFASDMTESYVNLKTGFATVLYTTMLRAQLGQNLPSERFRVDFLVTTWCSWFANSEHL